MATAVDSTPQPWVCAPPIQKLRQFHFQRRRGHNLDNTLMFAAYPVGGLLLFAAMLATAWWWDVLQRADGYLRTLAEFLPDPALLPLAAAIALVAQHPGFNELVEIFAALLLLLYLAWPPHAPAPQAERRGMERRRPTSAHIA